MAPSGFILYTAILYCCQQIVFGDGDFLYRKGVEMKCRDGFDMFGSRQLTCSGEPWSIKVPECKPRCPNPGIPQLGFQRNSSSSFFKHGSQVTFGCGNTYSLQGQQTIECRDGRWSHDIPKCLASCTNPGQIGNGLRIGGDFRHGRSVAFRCWDQYTLEGASLLSCNDGQWDNARPACKAPCRDPGFPQDGTKIGKDFRHRKIVMFSCKIGTKLMGQKTLQCLDGKWTYKKPSCKVVDCGHLKTPSNGKKIKETKTTYLGRAVFTCNKGFRLKGSSIRVCETNGQWSGITTTCEPVECNDPGKPTNGWRTPNKNKYVYQDTVRFECKTNFTRVGKSDIVCQPDGMWSGYKVFCLAPCKDPGIPKYGIRFDHNFANGETVRFGCISGRPMTGSPYTTCNDGRWNNDMPSCYRSCTDPGSPLHGRMTGDVFTHDNYVDYVCDDGYHLLGSKRIQCKDGNWSQSNPRCQTDCGSPLGMENKKFPGVNIRASSTRDWIHKAREGRLNGPRAWCSGRERNPYIEIDFGKPYKITSLATQGSNHDNRWVGSYSVRSNLAGSLFTTYRENKNEKVFLGNTDTNTTVKNRLKNPLIARKIRFQAIQYEGFLTNPACMRVEIYGCDLPLDCIMVGSRIVAKWTSNLKGGFRYYKAYLTSISNHYWRVEIENENHVSPRYKRLPKYDDLPFVLDVPPKHEELRVGTRVLVPWRVIYYTSTIMTTRDRNNRYQVRADDNDRALFTIDKIRLLKAPNVCGTK